MSKQEEKEQLTPEQKEVMNVNNENVIVSASAGSGKTFIMIKKIADYITEKHIHVNELLVLTYTNAAASEMKQKLIKELQELAVNDPELVKEIEDISSADISTFDSFCQKLVKRYFYVLEIDPSFNIIQGSEQTEIQKRAIKKAIKNYKKTNEERYFNLLDSFASNRTDKNVYELVLHLFTYQCSILDNEDFNKTCFSLFENNGRKATNLVFDKFKKEVMTCKKLCQEIITLCVNFNYQKNLIGYNERMTFFDSLLCCKDFGQFLDVYNNTNLSALPNNKVDEKLKIKKDAFKVRFENLKKDIEKFGTSEDYKNSISYCKEITLTLIDLCKEFKNEYDKIKLSKNVFDYNDIERFTLKLFEKEEILSQIKNSYKKIFVDEFQDANLIQEKIINCLSHDNNLFFVGDLKQAIYGFRLSNSKIFERIAKDFEKEKNSKSLKLNCNFRTTMKVLSFVNKIFDVIMTEEISSVDYKGTAELVAKAEYQEETDTTVELDILYGKEEKETAQNFVYDLKQDDNDKLDSHICEANYISNKITNLLGQQIYDAKLKKYRNIEYKDICILFRTRTHQDEFVSELNANNIPTIENSKTDLEEIYDIQILINLLKVSQNIKEDISLSSVMMSDLFCFDVDEMLDIKTDEYKHFYDCVLNYNNDEKIKEKIQKMQEIIKKFNKIVTFDGINKAFKYVLNETNYLFKIGHNINCISRRKNIFDYIDSFNNSKYNHSIYEYLNFLDTSTREQKVVSKLSSDNVVTLTTMHSSKGLEWPIIIIPDLGADLNKGVPGSIDSKLAINNELGIGIKYNDMSSRQSYESVFYYLVNNQNKSDKFSEYLRLLYVALTRAKNRLILIGSVNDVSCFDSFNSEYEIKKSNSYLSLIVNSLNCEDIAKVKAKIEKFNLYNDKAFECNVVKKEDCLSLQNEKGLILFEDEVDENKLNKCVDYIQKTYFNQEATHIAQKNSVSSILKQQEDYISINTAPQKLTLNEHLSEDIKKNEIGSAYHKVFELFDFNKVANWQSVKDVINRIEKQGEFTKETTKLLNINLIINNINIIKELVGDGSVIKEHTFVMQLPYCEIENSQVKDNVLVQGICDLIILKKDKTILVDYKFSSLDCKQLLSKYKKQLFLYSKAVEYGLNKDNVTSYLLSIKDCKLLQNK